MEGFNTKRGAEVIEMQIVDLMMWHIRKRGSVFLSRYGRILGLGDWGQRSSMLWLSSLCSVSGP